MPDPVNFNFGGSFVSSRTTPAAGFGYGAYPVNPNYTSVVPPFTSGPDPNINSISELVNQLNRTAQQQANAGRIPGETGLEEQSSANIMSKLKGQLPDDVVRELGRRAAEMGLQKGQYAGSPNTQSSLEQLLGLTSLDVSKEGQTELTAAEGRNPTAPVANAENLVVTPSQADYLNLQRMNAINTANNEYLNRQYNYDKLYGTLYGQNPYQGGVTVTHTPFMYGL